MVEDGIGVGRVKDVRVEGEEGGGENQKHLFQRREKSINLETKTIDLRGKR